MAKIINPFKILSIRQIVKHDMLCSHLVKHSRIDNAYIIIDYHKGRPSTRHEIVILKNGKYVIE